MLAATQIGKLNSSQKSAMTKLLNTGNKEDLIKVPGSGAKLAGAIMKKRPFKDPEDVANVEGIGEAKLKSLIGCIKNPSAVAKKKTK